MTKPEWGTKRTGPCGTKFYDFNKSPIICPGCGGEVITHDVKIKNLGGRRVFLLPHWANVFLR